MGQMPPVGIKDNYRETTNHWHNDEFANNQPDHCLVGHGKLIVVVILVVVLVTIGGNVQPLQLLHQFRLLWFL